MEMHRVFEEAWLPEVFQHYSHPDSPIVQARGTRAWHCGCDVGIHARNNRQLQRAARKFMEAVGSLVETRVVRHERVGSLVAMVGHVPAIARVARGILVELV